MKLDSITIATIVAFLMFVIGGAYLFGPLFQNAKMVYIEAQIQKNSELAIDDGIYTYAYLLNDSEINISYAVKWFPGCTLIKLSESETDQVCLDNEGMDELRYNSTFNNTKILIFKPWMLALGENWTWNTSTYLNYGGMMRFIGSTKYKVVGIEEYENRSAFVVEIDDDSGLKEYDYVDVEKRILLRASGQGYEVKLVSEQH